MMTLEQEKLTEMVTAQEFITAVGNDPRFSKLLEDLKYALALDRQDMRKTFHLVAAN